jgi:hypothetical protein
MYVGRGPAFDNSDFVTEAVLDFLKSGCIEKVKIKPIVVNPLTVSIQKLGKRRLILDLREVNKHVMKQTIKFEASVTKSELSNADLLLFLSKV